MPQKQLPAAGFKQHLQDAFSIDLRSLALFRIGIALTLLFNLVTRHRDLVAMYTDDGFLPVAAWREISSLPFAWSVHALSGSPTFVQGLFLLHAMCAIWLLVGWRSRAACIVCWLLLISLHHRNPVLLSGGDVLLGLFLFWGCFLPLDLRLSINHYLRRVGVASNRYFSVATCCLMIQIFLMYFVTGLSKCNEVWIGGDALFNVFHYGAIVRPLGSVMINVPWLLHWMTIGALVLELTAPWFLFVTAWQNRIRLLALLGLIGLHVGIELTMDVMIFSWVSLAGLSVFVPTRIWEMKTNAGHTIALTSYSSPKTLMPQRSRRSIVFNVFCVIAICYALVFNGFMIVGAPTPAWFHQPGELFGWNQSWNMFCAPSAIDYRSVAVAELPTGERIDVMHGGRSIDLSDIRTMTPKEPSQRWMLVMLHLQMSHHARFRPYIAHYFFNQWNTQHDDGQQIQALHHVHVIQPNPDADPRPAAEYQSLAFIDTRESGKYRQGERHGPWRFSHDDGSLAASGEYELGKQTGKWTFYHPNGIQSALGAFEEGKKVGEWVTWYPSGKIESRGTYVDSTLDGEWRFYDEQGTCVRESYQRGELIVEFN